ncbi:hypothetical protein B7494_g6243 [Chlorociboria aeruginascens]|nr:hypothetical protein B7494_g6243 [Chlorociboria aeruginascens]
MIAAIRMPFALSGTKVGFKTYLFAAATSRGACSPNPGYDVNGVAQLARLLASHSWEYGAAAEAFLELSNSSLSVFGEDPFPGGDVPVVDWEQVDALAYVEPFIRTDSQTLIDGDGAVGDPASLGVSAILIGQTNPVFLAAASRQEDYVVNVAPRAWNGAISQRNNTPELWADFMYMAPPFLAYYAVATSNTSLLQLTIDQCGLYRQILQANTTAQQRSLQGLWEHIIGPQDTQPQLWSTGNAWVAAGMARVLATTIKWRETACWQPQQNLLTGWIKEIIDGAMGDSSITSDPSTGLLRNILNDTSWFGETSGTALLASVVYRMAVLAPETFSQNGRYIAWADSLRGSIASHVNANGTMAPAVNPLDWGSTIPLTTGSPEGQSFGVLLAAAYRDWGSTPYWVGKITTGPIAVDMSSSWNWKTNITEKSIKKTASPDTGNFPPNVQNAVLFQGPPDDVQVYLYGGITPTINESFPGLQWPTTDQYTLWGFDTNTYVWTQYDIFSTVPQRPSEGAFAEIPELGLAFYMNGMISGSSSLSTGDLGNKTIPLDGMVVIDLKTYTARNISTDSITNGQPRIRGGMIAVPKLGPNGILVTIGGATQNSNSLNLIDMNQVNIFDISAITGNSTGTDDGWYTQIISGNVPQPRVDFCLVLASAPDNSSHNIYMYGGWDPTQDKYYDEVWVLSLPSFVWIQIYQGTAPRYGHSCHVVGNRQMVTVGGLDNANATDNCDWEYMSVAIFDMTEGTVNGWGSVFSANKPPYQVNSQIVTAVGGDLNGSATQLLPQGGWSSTQVANLFTGTNNQTAPVGTSLVSINTPNTTIPNSGNSDNGGVTNSTSTAPPPQTTAATAGKKNYTAAIAGGSAGGVVALILLGFLVQYCMHKPSKRPSSENEQLNTGSKAENEGQESYTKPELGTENSRDILREGRGHAQELFSDIHGVLSEAGGSPMSELRSVGRRKTPVELDAWVVHEKDDSPVSPI